MSAFNKNRKLDFNISRFQIPSASQVRLLARPYDRSSIGLEF